jgi:acetoacetyl-CoA synthetase
MSTVARSSPFVQIKAGCEEPPIFIAHGLSGTVQFRKLARHIQTDHTIYGIRAPGVNGLAEPLERVEDMAKLYLEGLDVLLPKGPYMLIGYSFGGLVALEMAQRLSESGKTVALLVLIDAYPHPHFLPALQRLPLFGKRVKSHLREMRQLSPQRALAYFVNGLKRRLHFPGALHESQRPPETLGLSFAETALRRVNQKAYLAYSRYQPRFYNGKISFVATRTESFFPGDPCAVWGHLASDFEVEAIPGDHLSIVTTDFEQLAAVLTKYIKQVPSCQLRS